MTVDAGAKTQINDGDIELNSAKVTNETLQLIYSLWKEQVYQK